MMLKCNMAGLETHNTMPCIVLARAPVEVELHVVEVIGLRIGFGRHRKHYYYCRAGQYAALRPTQACSA